MYHFDIGKLHYKYLIGPYTVGIITPSAQKHFRTIREVRGGRTTETMDIKNGSSDNLLTAEEVAAYVLKHKLI